MLIFSIKMLPGAHSVVSSRFWNEWSEIKLDCRWPVPYWGPCVSKEGTSILPSLATQVPVAGSTAAGHHKHPFRVGSTLWRHLSCLWCEGCPLELCLTAPWIDPGIGNAALPTLGGEQTLGLGVKGEKLVMVIMGNLNLFWTPAVCQTLLEIPWRAKPDRAITRVNVKCKPRETGMK